MFPHSDLVTVVDQFMTIDLSWVAAVIRVWYACPCLCVAKPNLLGYSAQTGQQKTLATAASSRKPDQVPGFMALDDTLMLHAFDKESSAHN